MTRIWWCQEHNSQSHGEHTCMWAYSLEGATPCRVIPMRLIPDNAPFVVPAAEGQNEEPYELGWCAEHHDVARRWPDGSWSCWWESVVEASGDHHPADFQPLWAALDGETP